MMLSTRRGFLAGLGALLAAPAIARSASMDIPPLQRGQLWAIAAQGGFLYTDELSEILLAQIGPLTSFQNSMVRQ